MNPQKTLLEKNIDKFICNNFNKKDRKKDLTLHFEWFVNSMHIWNESSLYLNAKPVIGKEIALGNMRGADSFYIKTDKGRIFTLTDNVDEVINYINNESQLIEFVFIQSKLTAHINWADFLNLIDIPLLIWKGQDVAKSQPELAKVTDFINTVLQETSTQIAHKLSIYFYTNKKKSDILVLESEWNTDIENKKEDLGEFFQNPNIIFRGSQFITDIFERYSSNDYSMSINKNHVINVDSSNYLIGYITAKELLDSVAPKIEGSRKLRPDVFVNNIRLYLGQSEINKQIEKTLIEEPSKFHYYNNGLTVTTKEIDSSNSINYNSKSVNIVNGCQTTNSIFNAHDKPGFDENLVKVPVRIIVAQNEQYDSITIRSNAQNGVTQTDLLSITSMQKELQEKFSNANYFSYKYAYKRQNGENIPTDIDYIIQVDDILRAIFSTLFLIPNKVLSYFDKTTSKYIDIAFKENLADFYVLITVLSKVIESYLESNYLSNSRLKFHILHILYRIAAKNNQYIEIQKYVTDFIDDDDDLSSTLESISKIYSTLYVLTKDEVELQKVIDYIMTVLKNKYPSFIDISTKIEERVLYRAVVKLKRIRVNEFNDFDVNFPLTLEEILK